MDSLSVTDGTLPLLGIRPALGRLFTAEDDAPGSAETVILSHEFWQRVFKGDPNAIGQSLVVDGSPTQVIGVLPPGFRFLRERPALVLPFRINRAEVFVGNFSYQAIGRLKPGTTMAQASADIARLLPGIPDHFPMPPGFSREMYNEIHIAPNLRPLARDVVGDIGNILWVLLGAVGIVLLVACANIANLFLVRAEGRQQELAIRTALGASRTQVVGALLAEAAALSAGAGLLGLALAYGGIRLLLALNPTQLPRLDEIAHRPDRHRVRAGGLRRGGVAVRAAAGREVRQPAAQHHAEGRRPRLERRPRAASRPSHAGGGAGGAGPRAAGGVGPDDPHVPGDARTCSPGSRGRKRSSRCASPSPRRW